MSHVLPCGVLGWAEINEQLVELLPARTVLSAGPLVDFTEFGDDGGHGGTGGSHNTGGMGGGHNTGGTGVGGNGGDASAAQDNDNYGDGIQVNLVFACGGAGGDGHGGAVHAPGGAVHAGGGDGGHGGNDFYAK